MLPGIPDAEAWNGGAADSVSDKNKFPSCESRSGLPLGNTVSHRSNCAAVHPRLGSGLRAQPEM